VENGELHETGDRWQLDMLIPNRDRRLVGPQIPRTDLLQTNTKVQITTTKVDSSLALDTSVCSVRETGNEVQGRLRRFYLGEKPRADDRFDF
jgi:hypothetical protein